MCFFHTFTNLTLILHPNTMYQVLGILNVISIITIATHKLLSSSQMHLLGYSTVLAYVYFITPSHNGGQPGVNICDIVRLLSDRASLHAPDSSMHALPLKHICSLLV